ncbi:PorP/SprF family type IX secretion system membrane protein [Chitinophaga qingshengii]|uniref:PorP/SprF family type IX secretion system membrane protein n=1 Tax=Chitinophaga qingshengii TaxID=1569794 RepID=A0ABR7TRA6_9BACT|nr:PorP/SprF family type IX secretion system membrane protein [Chitinophaga qingshengii]MBC9933036.1 PorP/SprF family type IX secretion system membrane protein [Chitinophaga qingshengii]
MIKTLYTSLLLFTGMCLSLALQGQNFGNSQALLEPSGTQYFHNQYLANPAMAGLDTGLHVNAAYRNQWNGMNGAPVTKFLSADIQATDRMGLGMNIFNDVAGLINRTRVALSYAYRIPLGQRRQQLSFGLSAVWNVQRLDLKTVNGDMNDPSFGAFNRRDNYFEAEYGMAYTDQHLNIQASLPNIRNLVTHRDEGVNGGSIFFSAVSYRFLPEGSVLSVIEPKLCFRGVRGYDNILDAGLKLVFLEKVANFMVMYHSSQNVTTGIGVNVMKTLGIQAMYTFQTGGLKTYVNGTYEIGATLHLFK